MRLNPVVRVLPGTNSISRPQMPFTLGTYDYQRLQVTSGRRVLPIKVGVAVKVSPRLGSGKVKWKTAVRQYNCFLGCIREAAKTSCSCSVLVNSLVLLTFFCELFIKFYSFFLRMSFSGSHYFLLSKLFHFYYSTIIATSQQG